MKTAYICSPYSGDIKRNKEYARELTLKAIKDGYAIQTTQTNFPQTEQRGDAFQVRESDWRF